MRDFEGPLQSDSDAPFKKTKSKYAIEISDVLDLYLDYLVRMQKMDLDIASEFVQMASHLFVPEDARELLTTEEEVSELELLMESLEQH